MVNRCRSTGFFLALWCLALVSACGGSPANQKVSEGNQSAAAEVKSETTSGLILSPAPVKVMTIGDSITQADSGHKSYRYALWKKLVDTGHAFDMTGSMQGNFKGDPHWPDYKLLAFDRDHEGHWGFRVDQVLSEIDAWLKQGAPDIVLIHLGTNDIFQAQSVSGTLDELVQLIAQFRVNNAKVSLLLAQVIPSKFHSAELNELNDGIAGLAQKLHTSESPIYLIDTRVGFDPVIDTYDGVHPNESGEEKMAEIWLKGLMATGLFR